MCGVLLIPRGHLWICSYIETFGINLPKKKKKDKATKYGEECLRFEFDKVDVFVLKTLMSNTKDSKACLLKMYKGIVRIAIIKNRVHLLMIKVESRTIVILCSSLPKSCEIEIIIPNWPKARLANWSNFSWEHSSSKSQSWNSKQSLHSSVPQLFLVLLHSKI